MVPKPPGTSASNLIKAPRLPPLDKLKIKRPNQMAENPCLGIMTSVLGCWASSGQASQACAALEQSLRACMDAKKPASGKKNTINYHLSRMYTKQMIGPHKRKK
ncbi:mitochondrial ribosomal protein 10 [Venturia nashicola]|uniref:Small ribosomal subunit protein mS37 n=1 Tax=Venturia nashicola TaxID=86259 RepID=A0A4Z1NVZ0_9PEZI|nr:mitochondrial ribosomal protein 10 [Venturia nashicola]TLD21691.1 mitochondrial ribosomal protein 10 [Venturia nashicola]